MRFTVEEMPRKKVAIYALSGLLQKYAESVGRPFVLHKLKTVPPVENEPEFLELLEKFFSFSLPKFYNAESLAITLADKTRFLRDEVITQELREEDEGKRDLQTSRSRF